MYYQKKLIEAKSQLISKIFLYDNGNECVDVTGGWEVIMPSLIKKNATNIQFIHDADKGQRISTVNPIEFSSNDRLFITLKTSAPVGNYIFVPYNSVTLNNSTRLYNTKGKNIIFHQSYIPVDTEAIVEFYKPTSFNDVLSMKNSFATWYVYQVWIEKYDN